MKMFRKKCYKLFFASLLFATKVSLATATKPSPSIPPALKTEYWFSNAKIKKTPQKLSFLLAQKQKLWACNLSLVNRLKPNLWVYPLRNEWLLA